MSDLSYIGILSLKNFYSKIILLLHGELKKIAEQYSLSATRKSLCVKKQSQNMPIHVWTSWDALFWYFLTYICNKWEPQMVSKEEIVLVLLEGA